MAIFCWIGDDDFAKERKLEAAVAKALGDRVDDPLSRQILFATDTNIPSLADAVIEACSSVSLFSPEQAVIVRKCEALKAAEADAIATWLKGNPECLLFCEFAKLDKRSQLYKALKAAGTVEECGAPPIYKVGEWIHTHVTTRIGKRIAPDAVQYLADALGNDLALIDAEIQKILLFDPALQEINLQHCRTMVVSQRDMETYELQEPFGHRDTQGFILQLRRLLDNGHKGIQIVSALYFHTVKLMHTRSMLDARMNPSDIAKQLGANEFLFVKKSNIPAQALKWSLPVLCRILARLCEMDYELKNGRFESRAELELALCALVVR